MKTAQDTFNKVLDLLGDRLNQLGRIRTDDAWQICKDHLSYSSTVFHFRKIMDLMVEQRKAIFIKNGQWEITKANEKRRPLSSTDYVWEPCSCPTPIAPTPCWDLQTR